MRKTTALAAAVAIAAIAPLSAGAADGTISFTGEITAPTCTISTPGGADFTVTLPSVARNALKNAGQTAGTTSFAINLSNCSADQAGVWFQSGPTVQNGRLVNQAPNGAQQVQVQLLDEDGDFVYAGNDGARPTLQDVNDDGTATLTYQAEYYATGAATVGAVSTSVQYNLTYL